MAVSSAGVPAQQQSLTTHKGRRLISSLESVGLSRPRLPEPSRLRSRRPLPAARHVPTQKRTGKRWRLAATECTLQGVPREEGRQGQHPLNLVPHEDVCPPTNHCQYSHLPSQSGPNLDLSLPVGNPRRNLLPSLRSLARALLLPLLALVLPFLLSSHRPALAEAQAQIQQSAQTLGGASRVGPPLQLSDIAQNSIFMSSFIAWAMAQSLKVVTNFAASRVWDWRMVFASGGMPSSHSAMCCGLTAAVALMFGFQGPLFPIALAFTLIVMYDATSVRYHAGVQAKVLNVVVAEMLQGHPVSEKKLKELLGHTPLQVAMGASLGIAVAFLYHKNLGLV